MATLRGKKVAILAAEGFEQAELTEPRKALEDAGAQTRIASPAKGEVQGWQHFDKNKVSAISSTPAPCGWTRMSASITGWSPAASPTTSRRSIGR